MNIKALVSAPLLLRRIIVEKRKHVALLWLAGLSVGLAAGQTSRPPIPKLHVVHPPRTGEILPLESVSPSIGAQASNSNAAAVAAAGTGGGSLTYFCDPIVDATVPGTCNYLNTVIAGLYTSTFSNINANIYITFGKTGLGQSVSGPNQTDYSTYLAALQAKSSGNALDVAALASLPATEPSLFNGGPVNFTPPLGRFLGLTDAASGNLWGITSTAPLAVCTLGGAGCYDGVITITPPADFLAAYGETLYFRQIGGSLTPSSVDFYTVVEHETDEVLGTSSCVSTPNALTDSCSGGNGIAPVDLFRYQSAGNRVFISSTPGAYFSYNGGNSPVEVYNTLANGQDYADWATNCKHVQDSVGCNGQAFDITNDGGVEISVLDAIGYNVVGTQNTTGQRPVAVLLCQYSDKPNNYGFTLAGILGTWAGKTTTVNGVTVDNSINGLVQDASLGTISFQGTKAFGWYTLPNPLSSYPKGSDAGNACIAAAQQNGVDLTPFTYVAVYMNDILNDAVSEAWTATFPGPASPTQWNALVVGVRGLTSPPMVLHELGHVLSNDGSHTDSYSDPLGPATHFGDDPSSNPPPSPIRTALVSPGWDASRRELMGFIPAASIAKFAGGTQTYNLSRLTQPIAGLPTVIEVPLSNGAKYVISARTRIGYDSYPDLSPNPVGNALSTEGVRIEIFTSTAVDTHIQMSNPGGDPNGTDAVWLTGQTYTDTANGITIAVVNFNSTGNPTAQITVTSTGAPATTTTTP